MIPEFLYIKSLTIVEPALQHEPPTQQTTCQRDIESPRADDDALVGEFVSVRVRVRVRVIQNLSTP
jgi:hypothetical protein